MTMPRPIHTAYSAARPCTCDHATTSTTAAIEPAVINGRGLCVSSQRPTATPARPETASDSEKAPVSSAVVNPSSRCMGSRNAANA